MEIKKLITRCIVLIIGLFVVSLGVSLSVRADLGTSPISCVPYVYSLQYPLSMGTISTIIFCLFILAQVVILKTDFHPIQLLQIPVAMLFGLFVDLNMSLTSGIHPANYFLQWMLCLLSCAVIAFGVFLQVKANVTYLAPEGLALTISKRYRIEFGKVKVGLDSSLVIVGIVSSFLMFHELLGVREGTVAAALIVGTIVRFYNRKIRFFDSLVEKNTTVLPVIQLPKANFVITIAREFGSGGHEIGGIVAQKLGIAFYDNKLIDLSAVEGGLTHKYVKENEQKLKNKLLFDLYEQNYAFVDEEKPALDTLFLTQSKVIRDIAQQESCVIVGRCADFILQKHPNCFNVFVHADKQYRINRISKEFNCNRHEALKQIEHKDRERTNYCLHYTGKIWGKADNYPLSIDSSVFGTEKAAELIIEALQAKKQQI